ncbi:hypothetical protein VCHA50P415_10281 [Vibrio chagasii]|nr:hypothetical protein VCHA27O13_10260 [Vibrio chagasii]CAH6833252.1 hypothetical protein VCHA34P131_10182 [Vibrio chagasii]CAH6836818.1 hypothetical protein VCHA32P90_10273 [Vibrio chagasii]CAH6839249.1 hypothetical protein VCHA34P112_10100 [Vibrio chagasii]CAH6841613.1 hypothetical protein VCHA34P116_10273 [Vibrio chagasii]
MTKVSNEAYNAVTIIISYWLVYSAGLSQRICIQQTKSIHARTCVRDLSQQT